MVGYGPADSREPDGRINLNPDPDWKSKFDVPVVRVAIELEGGFTVDTLLPEGWSQVPPQVESQIVFTDPEASALIIFGYGMLRESDTTEKIAISPANSMSASGYELSAVMSIPVTRSVEPVNGHMVNFLAKIPGDHLGKDPSKTLDYFKYITVVESNGHWFSIETSAWGEGCDPVKEIAAIAKFHSNFTVRTS